MASVALMHLLGTDWFHMNKSPSRPKGPEPTPHWPTLVRKSQRAAVIALPLPNHRSPRLWAVYMVTSTIEVHIASRVPAMGLVNPSSRARHFCQLPAMTVRAKISVITALQLPTKLTIFLSSPLTVLLRKLQLIVSMHPSPRTKLKDRLFQCP